MSAIALIATDLDGTLFYDRENITPRDRAALQAVHAAGITVVLATGREFQAAAPALDRLGLWDFVDHIIMAGGAQIYDVKKRETITTGAITPDRLTSIFRRYRNHAITTVLPCDNLFHTNRLTPEMQGESDLLGIPLVLHEDLAAVFTKPSTKLIFHGTTDEVEAFLPLLAQDHDPHVVFRRSHDNYIDCYAAGVSKSAALLQLCGMLGIDMAQTAAIGDNHNDIDLLAAAGKSACPDDGVEAAKQAADFVTCAAHEGAFAAFCTWLGLI